MSEVLTNEMLEKNAFLTRDIKLSIRILEGGFVLSYTKEIDDGLYEVSEIFTTQRKLNAKVKEVVELYSRVK